MDIKSILCANPSVSDASDPTSTTKAFTFASSAHSVFGSCTAQVPANLVPHELGNVVGEPVLPPITQTHQSNDPPYRQTNLKRASSIPTPIPLPEESLAGGKGPYPWTAEEDDLLIELQDQGMKWTDLAKSLDQYLYKQSPISCCRYYQDGLEKQVSWDEEKQQKLIRIYARYDS
jgi:hypothetical protein